MATPNPKTRALYARLQEVLGDEHADTLMTYLHAEPSPELATKSHIGALEARLDQLDQRWESCFQTLDDRIYGLQDVFRDQLKTAA